MANPSREGHENNFAILHFIGALMVMYGHQYALLQLSIPAMLGNGVQSIGVKMIFVITGYLVTNSFLREQRFGNYIKRRLIRIFPAYIVCILLCTLILGSLVTTVDLKLYFANGWTYVLNNLMLKPDYYLPGVFADNPYAVAVNGSIWTIPVEMVMYCVIGVLGMALHRFPHKKGIYYYSTVVLAACVGLFVHLYGYPETRLVVWGTDWYSALNIIPYLMIGSLFEVAGLKKYCNLQLAALIFAVACFFQFRYTEVIALLVLPYFTMSFALCEKPLFSGAFRKNNISYGIYLYGFPVQQLLIYVLKVRMGLNFGANWMYAFSLAITVVIALLSRQFIETPIEGFLRRKLIPTRAPA